MNGPELMCRCCGLPAFKGSIIGGADLCSWCDSGMFRDGSIWEYRDCVDEKYRRQRASTRNPNYLQCKVTSNLCGTDTWQEWLKRVEQVEQVVSGGVKMGKQIIVINSIAYLIPNDKIGILEEWLKLNCIGASFVGEFTEPGEGEA